MNIPKPLIIVGTVIMAVFLWMSLSGGAAEPSMTYTEANWKAFVESHKGNRLMKFETLCRTDKGREVELLRTGGGYYRMVLTARHDSRDAVASYVMEGFLDAVLGDNEDGKWLQSRVQIMAVPFMDKDGVEENSPGKDYSDDYGQESVLSSIKAIKERLKRDWAEYYPTIGIDLHGAAGDAADRHKASIVGGPDRWNWEQTLHFAGILKGISNAWGCETVEGNDLEFRDWLARLTSIRFAARLEVSSDITPEQARAFGRDLALAVRRDLEGDKSVFIDSYSNRADLKFKVSLPKGYDKAPGKKWPMILWLHGAGPIYNLESVTALGVPRYVLDHPEFPFITLTPLVPVTRWEACTEALNILLDEVTANYRVDAQRIYMTGQSLGGCGTWEMAMQHPEKFAAVAPASGGGCFPGMENMKGIPVWAIHGDDDVLVPRKYHQETVDAFRKVGGEVKFPAMPGIGHDVYRDVYMKPDLYDWFLQYTNPGLKPVPQNFDEVEMVTVEPMLVAFAKSPASDNWKSVEQFAADNHLTGKPQTRFFTLNWRSGGRAVTVDANVKGNEQFKIMKVLGGRYVVRNVPPRLDAGPGPLGIYRDEARACRWLSLHVFKFALSGTIYEYSGSPLKQLKTYMPVVEHVENINKEKQK